MLTKLNPNWIFIFVALLVSFGSATDFYGVCVGIDDYPGTVNDLDYCTEDAEALKDILVEDQDWTSDNISLLLDTDAYESDIDDALYDLSATFGKTIWFSFSGHGGSTGMIPANSINARFTPAESEDAVDPPAGYDEYAFFIDACYSGIYPRDLDNGVITSGCDYDELAYEEPALQHGIYSYYLVEGLTDNAADPGGIVSAEDLFNYASPRTTTYESDQHPQMDDNYSGDLNLYAPSTSGTLIDNENWTGTHTLSGNITVPTGVTLTISYEATVNLNSYEITVNSGGSMEIEAGASLSIGAYDQISVYGSLVAVGASGNWITFNKSETTGWDGIRFYDSSNDSECKLQYCQIKNVRSYSVYCYRANPTIENCLILNGQQAGIYLYYPDYSTTVIEDNVISGMDRIGIFQYYGDTQFTNNTISTCDNGILIRNGYSHIDGNTILNHSEEGIKFDNSDGNLTNNSIYSNSWDGVYCYNYSDPYFRRFSYQGSNVIRNNSYNGVKIDATSLPNLSAYDDPDDETNSFYSNGASYDEVYSSQSSWVLAKYNYWGAYPPSASRFYGNVNYDNYRQTGPRKLPAIDPAPSPSTASQDQSIPPNLPSNADAQKIFYEGYLLEADEKLDEALVNFKSVIANYPESFEAMLALSRIRMCLKRSERLNEYESYLSSIYQPNKSRLLGGKVLEMQIAIMVKNKSINEALTACASIVKDFPESELAKGAQFTTWMIHMNDTKDLVAANTVMDHFGVKYPNSKDYTFMREAMGETVPKDEPVINNDDQPLSFEVSDNFPNPFNPETKIQIKLPQDSNVKLQVYNIRGQIVATPFNGNLPAGSHTVNFNASTLPSGIYFYKIVAGEFSDVKRMLLVK